MSFLPGILIIITFGIFAGLMMSRKMPALLALPCMAVIIAVISGGFYDWPAAEPVVSRQVVFASCSDRVELPTCA